MADRVRLTLPSERRSLPLVDALTKRFCEVLEIPRGEGREVVSLVRDLVGFALDYAYPDDPTGQIELTLDLVDGAVHVDVHDWGRPLTSAGGEFGALPPQLAPLGARADDLRLINLGADGKRISLQKRVSHSLDTGPEAHDFEARTRAAADGCARERIAIRDAGPGDAESISQLLYANYHLSYGHPDFYRPQWLAQEIVARRILSSVAVHDGEVIGHHALMLQDGATSGETGAAVVHPAFRGLGIFSRLFDHTLERTAASGLEAVWGRAVTVHPFSQRSERSHGYRETALMLGSVPAKMAMEGVAGSEAGSRTASLLAYRMLSAGPRNVVLPSRYESALLAGYANVELGGAPAATGAAADGPALTSLHDETRATGVVTVSAWDAERFSHELRHLLAAKADVVYTDLDLTLGAATDAPIESLNELGFFYAGLVLCGVSGHDYVRLQRLNAENVELERIVCDSDYAQELLSTVLADRERVDG